jgi:flavine halogenase
MLHVGVTLIQDIVIQGIAAVDFTGKLTQEELSRTVEFAVQSYNKLSPEEEMRAIELMSQMNHRKLGKAMPPLSDDDQRIISTFSARKMLQCEATINLNHFASSSLNGFAPRLERGAVGLSPAARSEGVNTETASRPPIILKDGDITAPSVKEDITVN